MLSDIAVPSDSKTVAKWVKLDEDMEGSGGDALGEGACSSYSVYS